MSSPSSSNSPARSPPAGASVWSCSHCTFDNPIRNTSCEICEAARLVGVDAGSSVVAADAAATPPRRRRGKRERVEVDADSPAAAAAAKTTPPRRSGRKRERAEVDPDSPAASAAEAAATTPPHRCGSERERAESPDVADLCDSAGREAPLAKKGNHQTHLDKKTFKIMTYNVWFREDLELSRRMDAIGNLIKVHRPDILCFQEVTPYIYVLLQSSDWWKEYKCLLSQKIATRRPYYCLQLSKLPVRSSESIPFSNSIMGRELCIADIRTGKITNLVVATTHLESPCPAPPKWDQMYSKERVTQAKKSLGVLGPYRNAIFCGDMNWDDKGDGPFPMPGGWIDAWVELKPGEDGWTYDTKANRMLSGNRKLQKRMDRFVCKLEDFKIENIEMIGTEEIPGVLYYKEKKVCKEICKVELPVFPSDHFGLILTVTQLENDNL